jgi:hypothetical protein
MRLGQPRLALLGLPFVLLLFGVVSVGHSDLGLWIYFDFLSVFQFLLVLWVLRFIRGLIVKWWAVSAGESKKRANPGSSLVAEDGMPRFDEK